MSSVRVRTQNKIFELLGTAKKSTNVDFDLTYDGFQKIDNDIDILHNALRGFISSLTGFHMACNVLSTAIQDVSNIKSNECPNDVKEFVHAFNNASFNIDVTMFNSLLETYEKSVMKPSNAWKKKSEKLKEEVETFQECRSCFDHYSRKVSGMREARDKKTSSGKQEKTKAIEKLNRNEKKLVDASKAYQKVSDSTISHLKHFINTRYTTLAPLIQRVVKFRLNYSKSVNEATHKKFDKVLKNPAAVDSNLDELDKMEVVDENPTEKISPEFENKEVEITKESINDEPSKEVTEIETQKESKKSGRRFKKLSFSRSKDKSQTRNASATNIGEIDRTKSGFDDDLNEISNVNTKQLDEFVKGADEGSWDDFSHGDEISTAESNWEGFGSFNTTDFGNKPNLPTSAGSTYTTTQAANTQAANGLQQNVGSHNDFLTMPVSSNSAFENERDFFSQSVFPPPPAQNTNNQIQENPNNPFG